MSATVDYGQLANYGVLGIVFVGFSTSIVKGWLVPGNTHTRVLEEAAAARDKAENDEREAFLRFTAEITTLRGEKDRDLERERLEKTALRQRMDDQVIPLLTEMGHLMREALRTIERGRG